MELTKDLVRNSIAAKELHLTHKKEYQDELIRKLAQVDGDIIALESDIITLKYELEQLL